MFKETKVGAKLTELTTRRVIVLVMSIMFSIPIFDVATYLEGEYSYDNGLSLVQMFENDTSIYMQESLSLYLDYHKDLRTPVVFINFTYTNETF